MTAQPINLGMVQLVKLLAQAEQLGMEHLALVYVTQASLGTERLAKIHVDPINIGTEHLAFQIIAIVLNHAQQDTPTLVLIQKIIFFAMIQLGQKM
jgi:hypothetical protein